MFVLCMWTVKLCGVSLCVLFLAEVGHGFLVAGDQTLTPVSHCDQA